MKMQPLNQAAGEYLRVSDLCKALFVSDETIYRWIKKQGLPAHRAGKQWLFKKHEVDSWVEAQTAQSVKEKNG